MLKDKDICVTLASALSLDDQVKLSINLEKIGVNFLQTEGFANTANDNFVKNFNYRYILESVSNSFYSLFSTYVVSRFVKVPIITFSKLDFLSSSIAISFGASVIGIVSNVSQQ